MNLKTRMERIMSCIVTNEKFMKDLQHDLNILNKHRIAFWFVYDCGTHAFPKEDVHRFQEEWMESSKDMYTGHSEGITALFLIDVQAERISAVDLKKNDWASVA